MIYILFMSCNFPTFFRLMSGELKVYFALSNERSSEFCFSFIAQCDFYSLFTHHINYLNNFCGFFRFPFENFFLSSLFIAKANETTNQLEIN